MHDREARPVGGAPGAAHSAPLHGAAAAELRQAMQKLRLIAGAITGSVVTAVGMVWLLTGGLLGGEPLDMSVPSAWPVRLLVPAAVVALVAAPLVERFLLSPSGASYLTSRSPGVSVADRLRHYVTAKVVGLGLREVVGLIGFVLGLLQAPVYAYVLGACSLLALAFGWPREREVAAYAGRGASPTGTP